MKNLILKLSPTKLFIIDAIGALVTAITHGIILVEFRSDIGFEKETFYFLATIAAIYCIYSTINAIFQSFNWRRNLRIIALANIAFCLLTLGLVFYNFNKITLFGKVYFFTESVIVFGLAYFELRYARKRKNNIKVAED